MDRDTDRTRLIRDRARDRLADPPCRIRRELETFRIVEFFDGFDQTAVSFLDQIQKQHPASDIFFRDRNDKTKVRGNEQLLCLFPVIDDAVQLLFLRLVHIRISRQLFLGLHAILDPLGNDRLFLRIEKGDLTNLFQIHFYRVVDLSVRRVRERLFKLRDRIVDRTIPVIDIIAERIVVIQIIIVAVDHEADIVFLAPVEQIICRFVIQIELRDRIHELLLGNVEVSVADRFQVFLGLVDRCKFLDTKLFFLCRHFINLPFDF